jgi:hypothetical protein
MTSIRMLAVSFGCSTLLCVGGWPSAPARAQVVERGVEGGAVGAVIGGILGGGKGAATGAAIGAGVGALSGAAEANARAHGYYGPPPAYGPPPPGYYGPPQAGYPPAAYISVAPPLLPVYDQPLCPGPGYVWTPGYWAYAPGGYYWVPGTWVLPPAVGLVWTPGYWGYEGGRYLWHAGYWGPHVGYYGGINYGFGYFGSGYDGGYWDHGVFFYNTAVTRVDTAVITNTYNKRAISTVSGKNVSFNGPGGITAQPTAQEVAWSRERHTQPTALQVNHQRSASANRALFATVNHGAPTVAATAKPGVFKRPEIVGPKAVATTNATVGAGSTVSGDKPLPHGQAGTAPVGSGQTGSGAGQQTAGTPHGVGAAVANGGAPGTGKHAFGGPNGPGGSLVGGAGPKTGQQPTAAQNGSSAAVANGQPGPGQNSPGSPHKPSAAASGAAQDQHALGGPHNVDALVANGQAGSGQGTPRAPHGPGATSVAGSGQTKGNPSVAQGSPKPHVKKNKPDKDSSGTVSPPPGPAQSM